MTDFPDVKLKALLSFPASVVDGVGVDVVKENGNYRFDIAYDDFGPPVGTVPDIPNQTVLVWNAVTQQYALLHVELFASVAAGQRERLTANRTYFVRVDGNDANNGLTNSAGGAFLTIGKAVSTIYQILDLGGFNVTIQVGAGTYTGNVMMSGSAVGQAGREGIRFTGDTINPSNVVLHRTGAYVSTPLASVFHISDGAMCSIGGFKIIAGTASLSFAIQATRGGMVLIDGNMEYGAATSNHIASNETSVVEITANYTISGGAGSYHYYITNIAALRMVALTVTLTGTPAFTTFATAHASGNIASAAMNYSGAAIGKRYDVYLNGVINTNGGGANYFPGDAVGTAATGGQYGV